VNEVGTERLGVVVKALAWNSRASGLESRPRVSSSWVDVSAGVIFQYWNVPGSLCFRSVIALGYGLDDRVFKSWRGLGIFLFTTASRTALGPTLPPIQWVPGALSLGVKWPRREADHSPPSSAEVKEWVELYIYSPNTPLWHGAQLKKAQWQLYLHRAFYLLKIEICYIISIYAPFPRIVW
jgi:hypothetical protein